MYTETAKTESWKHLLRHGCEILWAGIHCRVLHWKDDTDNKKSESGNEPTVVLENVETKEMREVKNGDISTGIETGQLILRMGEDLPDANAPTHVVEHFSRLATSSDAARRHVIRMQEWKIALCGKNISNINPNREMDLQVIKELKQDKKLNLHDFGPWTIYRGISKFKNSNGNIEMMIPKYHLRGKPKEMDGDEVGASDVKIRFSRLAPLVDELLTKTIETALKDKHHKLKPSKIWMDLKNQLENVIQNSQLKEEITLPSVVTVARRINKSATQYDIDVHKHSKDGANNLYRSTGVRIEAQRILETVQYDDIDTREFLIDPDTDRPWGTAFMTFGVDERSRAVVGSDFGAEYRNTDSALRTVFSSIRQKDMSAVEYSECEKEWIMHGLPGLVLLDNASYNKSDSFKLTLLGMGMDYALSRPKTPTNKSAVEHFNNRFKHQFVANLPGSCVNKKDQEGAKRAMKSAKFTLEEFALKANKFIVDEYLPQRMESGFSPLEVWKEQEHWVDLRAPKIVDLNFNLYSKVEVLKFRSSGGIERKDLRYLNEELIDLQRRIGWSSRVKIRVNSYALAKIYVYDPQELRWFSVPCIENPIYVDGLTEEVHKYVSALKRQRQNELKRSDEWRKTDLDDMREKGYALCKSELMTERGLGFRMKLALKGGTSALMRKNSNFIYRIPETRPPMENVKSQKMPDQNEIPLQKKMNANFQALLGIMENQKIQ